MSFVISSLSRLLRVIYLCCSRQTFEEGEFDASHAKPNCRPASARESPDRRSSKNCHIFSTIFYIPHAPVNMTDPASSRVFIKGLPPTITDVEFRKHFSQNGREVTDAKIFPNRRIGYVGYRTPEDAQKSVKYFNKTFMRMSRIGVEIARPAKSSGDQQRSGNAPTARRASQGRLAEAGVKRKRESETKNNDDPKLREFMEVMKPKSKKKAWETDAVIQDKQEDMNPSKSGEKPEEGSTDDDYEDVPRKSKRTKADVKDGAARPSSELPEYEPGEDVDGHGDDAPDDQTTRPDDQKVSNTMASDADWARSRTSRLLGLLDDEDEDTTNEPRSRDVASDIEFTIERPAGLEAPAVESSMPTPPSDEHEVEHESKENVNADIQAVRSSMRLFVRNLSYDVQEEDLEAEFASYGTLDEVCLGLLPSAFA